MALAQIELMEEHRVLYAGLLQVRKKKLELRKVCQFLFIFMYVRN